MSEKDELLEELKELRLWRGVFIAIAFTLGSWLVSHFEIFKSYKYIIGLIAEILAFIQIWTFNKEIRKKIKKLKEL